MLTQKRRYLIGTAGILVAVAAAVFVPGLFFPTDCQINLKTGDLRYRFHGIPLAYSNLAEDYRARIAEISSVPNTWITVATFPLPTSNNSHAMCQGFYEDAAKWQAVDPKIAKVLLGDVVRYIETTKAQYGLPDGFQLLGADAANSDWRNDESIQEYLNRREPK